MKLHSIFFVFLIPSLAVAQNRYDIVISEIMADPSPSVGLPNHEWIELKNTSASPIDIQNWRIGDATSTSGAFPAFTLQPDSFVIISSASAALQLNSFGTTISISSFPSFDNDGELLYIKSANGKIIHAVNYTSVWYKNDVKKEGGWTLEMIDTKNPCSGSNNWKASMHVLGGTPGKKNSADGINNDTEAPGLVRSWTTDSTTIILLYDEPVDSITGASISIYSIDGGITIISAISVPPLFNTVQLKTSAMNTQTIYTVTVTGIKDCRQNGIGSMNKVKTGVAEDALPGDWVINEILFDPRPNGYDYVEFYNSSKKVLDASKLFFANRNSTGAVSSVKALSTEPSLIFPGDHILVTTDPENLSLQYLVKNPGNVLVPGTFPSFPDDEGTVVALNFQGIIVDEVSYKDDWHFNLVENPEGVALERIDASGSSTNRSNWHSAASTAGYGTPTYKNSQYKLIEEVKATIEVAPNVFSPDNDGHDDIATIHYSISEPGYVANIILFDQAGRPVRHLARNSILGLTGYWNWDGLDDKGNRLPAGNYIVFTEIFNLQGKKRIFKNLVTLARAY
jgi:hypothetical protein